MRSRPTGCLSDLRVDRWLAGDLGAADEESARAHAAGCAACAARVARFREAHAASASEAAAGLAAILEAATPPARPRWRLWVPFAAGLTAAVAALALLVRPADTGDALGTRTKGPRAHLGFFVKHGDAVRRGGWDEKVSPGDLVRFTASLPAPRHVAIFSLDAAHRATIFYPADGRQAPLPAGADVELPRATELDGTLGVESIFALFCEQPIDLEAVRRNLQAGGEASWPRRCDLDSLEWIKVAAP